MSVFDRCVLLILLLCVSVIPLAGDDFFAVKRRIESDAPINWSVFYVAPAVKLSSVGHISNIYVYEDVPEPDYVADAGFDMLVSAVIRDRLILQLRESPFWNLYYENSNLQSFNNELELSAYTYLGHLNLKFMYANRDVSSRPTPEFGLRIRNISELLSLSLDYGDQKRFYVNVYGEQERFRYEDEFYSGTVNLKELMTRQEDRLGVVLYKKIFTATQLFLNYEYFKDSFEYAGNRGGTGARMTGGIRFPEIGPLTGSIRYGVQVFRPDNPEYEDFIKPFGDGEVSMILLNIFKFHFLVQTLSRYSIWDPDFFYVQNVLEGGVEYYLSKTVKVGYRHREGTLSYYRMSEDLLQRKDRLHDQVFSIGLRIFGDTTVGLEYHLYRVESADINFNRRYDFIGGTITYDF